MNVERIAQLLDQARRVLQNPSSNPEMAAVLLGIVAVLVVVLGLVIWLALTPRRKRVRRTVTYWIPDDEEPAEEPGSVAAAEEERPAEAEAPAAAEAPDEGMPAERAPETVSAAEEAPDAVRGARGSWAVRAASLLLGPLLIPVLIVAAVVSAYAVTSTQAVCAGTCHAEQRSVVTAKKAAHARCVDCHTQPLPGGFVANATDRVRMATRQLQGSPEGVRAVVEPDACERCHADLSGTRTSRAARVRMRHDEPLAAGMTCTECHGAVGHDSRLQPVSMARCLGCHDGTKASAECVTCHLTDVANAGRRTITENGRPKGELDYPVVGLHRRDCGGCHNQKVQCDSCHGVRMPHSARFVNGWHAKDAAFEKKAKCWKCHQENDCSACHQVPFSAAHTPTWKRDHAKAPANSQCVCHQDRQADAPPSMCAYCHGPASNRSDTDAP